MILQNLCTVVHMFPKRLLSWFLGNIYLKQHLVAKIKNFWILFIFNTFLVGVLTKETRKIMQKPWFLSPPKFGCKKKVCAAFHILPRALQSWFLDSAHFKHFLTAKIQKIPIFYFLHIFWGYFQKKYSKKSLKNMIFHRFSDDSKTKMTPKNMKKWDFFWICWILAVKKCLECVLSKNQLCRPQGSIRKAAHTFFLHFEHILVIFDKYLDRI